MKKLLKYLGYFLLGIVVLIGGALTYVRLAMPNVAAATDLKFEHTPERIERGRYLANSVSVCMDCHSQREHNKFSGPLKEGTFGMGGDRYDQGVGMPGVIYAKNITPEGIGRYTDGELFRIITTGVTKEGRPMFPFMPYPYYGRLDKEDVLSLIAYLRTLAPIKNDVPESTLDFPVNFIVRMIPQEANHQTIPPKTDIVNYGAYLTNAGGCIECHTQVDGGRIITDLAFGGGREFPLLGGAIVRSSNISPDPETGIGNYSEDTFINLFKMYADSSYVPPVVKDGEFNTYMPWTMYAHMERDDLAAIYAYLRTVKPIKNVVEKFSPAAK